MCWVCQTNKIEDWFISLVHEFQLSDLYRMYYQRPRRLRKPKKERKPKSNTAFACHLVLLSEEEENLKKEIKFFQNEHRLLPSTRRYTRRSPFLKGPHFEDYDYLSVPLTKSEARKQANLSIKAYYKKMHSPKHSKTT